MFARNGGEDAAFPRGIFSNKSGNFRLMECSYFSCSASSPQAAYPSPAHLRAGSLAPLRLLSPHSPLTLGLCGVPHPKECGQRGAPLCNPPRLSRVPAIQRRRRKPAYTGTPAPTAVPWSGIAAWQGPPGAPSLVLLGSAARRGGCPHPPFSSSRPQAISPGGYIQ